MARLVKSGRAALVEELTPLVESGSMDDLWKARSLLHAAKATAKGGAGGTDGSLDALLALTAEYHEFQSEVTGWIGAKNLSELATIFDIGAIGVLAVQDFIGGSHPSIPKLLLGGLSEALIILGSTQYIKGDRKMLEASMDVHLMHLHDRFWSLPLRFRGRLTAEQVEEVSENMEAFFAALRREDVPVEVRMAIAQQLYVVLVKLELASLPS